MCLHTTSYYYMCVPIPAFHASSAPSLSWCYWMCPHYYMCPHTTIYVSSYLDFILEVLPACRVATGCVLILLCMCPHTTIYVSAYYYICVLMLLYMCPHTYMCSHSTIYVSSYLHFMLQVLPACRDATGWVLILLYMCPHTAIYVSTYYYMCPHTCISCLKCSQPVLMRPLSDLSSGSFALKSWQVHLLYWYKSTCFTGTKVLACWYKSTCLLVQKYFLTGTKVQILTPEWRHEYRAVHHLTHTQVA